MNRIQDFQSRLLSWYRKNARHELPWRKTRDPYAIWISEAMLQQTQVNQVIPYYVRFLKKFPTVQALADAPLESIFDSWSGLGYYSRARNLHAAAQMIVREHAGQLPSEVDQLMDLPGIGRYTAGAVASIAYDRPAPILDGNVIRLLTRVFGIRQDPRKPAVQKKLWQLSAQLLLKDSPGDFNQALMELGALVCTPRRPSCPICPVKIGCVAFRRNEQEKIPARRAAVPRKRIVYFCGIVEKDGSFLLARRPFKGLLPGLWEFPGGERKPGESNQQCLVRIFHQRLGIAVEPLRASGRIRQILSHRELEIRAFDCRWKAGRLRPDGYLGTRWVGRSDLKRTPLTAGMRRLALTLAK